MGMWDIKWKDRVKSRNMEVEDDGRYVDDARVYLYPIKGGWRWESGDLWYKKEWEEEDALISPTEKTKRVVNIWKHARPHQMPGLYCRNIRIL